MELKIENADVCDAEELLDIYKPYVMNTAITFEYDVPSVSEFAERIKNISDKYPYIKAINDSNEILGYAYAGSFKGRKAYDWSVEITVYIKESMKRKGIGKLLYNELEDRLKKMGILNMNACIAVPKEADEYLTNDSELFHESLGFSKVGTFHDSGYKFNKWYDMIWMEKMIGVHTNSQEPVKFGLFSGK